MPSAYQPPTSTFRPNYAMGYLPSFMEQAADNERRNLMTQNMRAGAGAGGAPVDPMSATRDRILKDTEGRGDATMNDPRVNAALDYMGGVMGGQNEPYTQQVQNQLLSKHGDMTAAGEASQAESLREQLAATGGNPNDPSARAAMRQLDAGRQQSNNAALGDIQTQATLGNFDARSQAAQQVLSGRMGQLGEANSQYNKEAGYLNQTTQQGAHVNPIGQTPMFNLAGLYGNNMPAPQFKPLQMPQMGGQQDATQTPAYSPNYTVGSAANPVYAAADPYGGQQAPAPQNPGSGASPTWDPQSVFGGPPGYQAPGQSGGANYYTPPGAAAPQTNSASERSGPTGQQPAVKKQQRPAYQQFQYRPQGT